MLCIGPQVCAIARPTGRCKHRPLRTQGKALPGFAGYLRRKAAMHPSVCALRRIQLPLQGSLSSGSRPAKPLLQGEVPPQAAEGCGAWPCHYPFGPPQPLRRGRCFHRPASLRRRKAHGTMQASSPTDAGQSPAGVWKMCGAPSGAAAQKQPRTEALGAGLFCRDAGEPFGGQRPAASRVAVSETAASGVAGRALAGASASSPRRHSRCSSSGICSATQVPSSCCVIPSSISG